MTDTETALQAYLHERIPLTRAMQVRVLDADPARVRLAAPLAPNINHRDTVFGGSAAALATLAAWSVLHVRLDALGTPARVVIRQSRMRYLRPIDDEFEAIAQAPADADWQRFTAMLDRRGRARIDLAAGLTCRGEPVANFDGEFAALAVPAA